MKLTTKMRLTFGALYPPQASINDQCLVKDIDDKVMLTQDEQTTVDLKSEPGPRGPILRWDDEKDLDPKEVVFTNAELQFLKGRITEMDREKKITQNMLDFVILIRDQEETKEPEKKSGKETKGET